MFTSPNIKIFNNLNSKKKADFLCIYHVMLGVPLREAFSSIFISRSRWVGRTDAFVSDFNASALLIK
jgi:hypothetical protein